MATVPERVELAPGFSICRAVTGLWQIADMERGGKAVDPDAAAAAMQRYVDQGMTSFDMADHYGSAELITRTFLRANVAGSVQAFTKWVPDAAEPITREVVREGVQRSLDRMGVDCIDLLQFHWWDYLNPGYLDALKYLSEMQREGKIKMLGLTNFDTAHLRIIVKSGIKIHTNQVCQSLLDARASGEMARFCTENGIKLLCFGTIAGGLLSEKYLRRREPKPKSWSAMKYKRYIDVWGGWALFQELLLVLERLGAKHGVSIPNIAARYVMQQPSVGAVIIGARLTESEHIADTLKLFTFSLDAEDVRSIEAITKGRARRIPGDCGDEYRKPPFLTASGDLSHHVSSFPTTLEVRGACAWKTKGGRAGGVHENGGIHGRRAAALSGSVWEDIAGFSRAVRQGNRIYVSGSTAIHGTMAVAVGDAQAQATFVLDKLEGAIKALGGAGLQDVCRTRIYVRSLDHWEPVAREHGRRFGAVELKPASTLVQAALVEEEYLVEMEADAELQQEVAVGGGLAGAAAAAAAAAAMNTAVLLMGIAIGAGSALVLMRRAQARV